MSWDDLEAGFTQEEAEQKKREIHEEQITIARKFARAFGTDDGQAVFEHLFQSFLMKNNVSLSAQNVEYEAAFRNGQADVIKYITNQMARAAEL